MHANIESPEIECLQGRNHKGLQKPHLNVRNSLKCNNGIFKKDKNNTVAKSRRIEKINTSLRILDLKSWLPIMLIQIDVIVFFAAKPIR